MLPSEYPFRPPSIMMLTPSGRFELNTKVQSLCFSMYVSVARNKGLLNFLVYVYRCVRVDFGF